MTNDPKEIAQISGELVDAETVSVLIEFAPRLRGEVGPDVWDGYAKYRDHRYEPPLGSSRPSKKPHRVFLKCWFRFVADFCGDEIRWRSIQDGYSDKAGGQKLFGDQAKFDVFNDCGKLAFLTAKGVYPDLGFEDVREVMKSRQVEGANLDDYSVDPNESQPPTKGQDCWDGWEIDQQRNAGREHISNLIKKRIEQGEDYQDALKEIARKIAQSLSLEV